MNQPISTQRQIILLGNLADLFRDRAARQTDIDTTFNRLTAECQAHYDQQIAACRQAHEQEIESLNSKYMIRLEAARRRFELSQENANKKKTEIADRATNKHDLDVDAAEVHYRQEQALAERNFDQDERLAEEVLQHAKSNLVGLQQHFAGIKKHATKVLKRRGRKIQLPDPKTINPKANTTSLIERHNKTLTRVQHLLNTIAAQKSIRFVDEGWPVLLFIALAIGCGVLFGLLASWSGWMWIAAGLVVAFVGAVASRQIAEWAGRRAVAAELDQLHERLGEASISVSHAYDMIDVEHVERQAELTARRDQQLAAAKEKWQQVTTDAEAQLKQVTASAERELAITLREAQHAWDADAGESRNTFPDMMARKEEAHASSVQRMEFERQTEMEKLAKQYNDQWDALVADWRSGTQDIFSEVDGMNEYCQHHFHNFADTAWNDWNPSVEVPRAIPLGSYQADLAAFPGGIPADDQLRIDRSLLRLPAVLSFPASPSLLIKAENEGRDQAILVLQQAMLRMLTALPAGKVRFTIIDPTGLGQNFSAFMHLADFDERLVASRIWTETSHIGKRLADLTEHMENVIQKYLRNEFASIQEYNDAAGEVAEPFQVLVIANFPTNFSEESARRLVSIASSGARCGVFTLVSNDTKMKLPRNFDLRDLEAQANTLRIQDGTFHWQAEALAAFPLSITLPPSEETVTEMIRAAGQHATEANKVEVPFAAVVPPAEEWWTHDSRREIEVPLGRAGATKLQYMRLGKGTSQHVLVAGKTGSGKSTLMHALVTNLAIHYSPHELRFYLVDFKKGVEFKTYAEHQLPHARVVAIESEREFGLSVLQNLNEELQRRGETFRASGVQSLEGYRDACPDKPMPRLLLLVDEFQEFFVNDDKIASESSLLLDRLVRQGRAFGIHVMLGSQTLAGAYSLARSTLGQMAVRIALQCSESDAHLILSEENTAARLLSRPGEAIYNNANGMFEGNHPFQVVWLNDSQREHYLRQIRQLATDKRIDVKPPIVFEGNVAADPAGNRLLKTALQTANGSPAHAMAWLGSAVAIKDPTAASFRRQVGNNLLIVGQHEELATGMLATAVVSLAATARTDGEVPEFIVLDGGGFETTEIKLSARLKRHLPNSVIVPEQTQIDAVLDELAAEVSRRTEASDTKAPAKYVLIYNLARFRQLKKSDDDFGLSGFGEEDKPSPSKRLAEILRDGPPVGIHVLVWCDTYNNVTRWFDRSIQRDIAWRVLFQMSPTDSSNLMDSTAASQLGQFRAILYSDELGEFEKFRPYGPPSAEWMEQVGKMLANGEGSTLVSGSPRSVDADG